MKFTIVTTVLLGLLLTPALADYNGKASNQIAITGGYQVLTVNKEWNVVTIEQKGTQGAWKTIWNYETGLIASKVPAERACFLSRMDRKEMPSMDAVARLGQENRILQGQGQPKKQMTFTIKRTIRDVKSYGLDIFSMCRGLTTYITYRDRSVFRGGMITSPHTFMTCTPQDCR